MDFVAVVHAALKQAMKSAGEPGAADLCDPSPTWIWCDERDGSRIATFLDLKDPRRSSWSCPWTWTRTRFGTMAETGCSVWPMSSWEESGRQQADLVSTESRPNDTPSKSGRIWNNTTENALETSCLKACDWLFFSPCAPQHLEKELTAQQHLFPDYAQMKARIVTVINSRTRGFAPKMIGILSDEDRNHHASSDKSVESEDGELYRLEIRNGQKVFTKSRPDPSKGKGGGKG